MDIRLSGPGDIDCVMALAGDSIDNLPQGYRELLFEKRIHP